MSELDLTDYVTIAAKTWAKPYDWDELPENVKYEAREQVLPIVTVVLEAWQKNHPGEEDTSWLNVF